MPKAKIESPSKALVLYEAGFLTAAHFFVDLADRRADAAKFAGATTSRAA